MGSDQAEIDVSCRVPETADNAEIDGHVELVRHRRLHVRPHVRPSLGVVGQVAFLVIEGPREVVREVVPSTPDVDHIPLDKSRSEDVASRRRLVLVGMLGDDGPSVGGDPVVGWEPSGRIVEPVGALAGDDLDRRTTRNALFRDDLDHAGRGFRSVEGGCRRALDDLDPLDFLRVEVIETGGAVAGPGTKADDASVGADPVDVEQGLCAKRHRAAPANDDATARPDRAAADLDGHPGDLSGQHLLDVRWRAGLERLGRVHGPDHVGDCSALNGPDRPGDDDLVQAEGFDVELEVHGRGFPRSHGNRGLLRAVPDHLDLKRVHANRHVEEEVASLAVRHGADSGFGDRDLCAGQRAKRFAVDDGAGDGAALRQRGSRCEEEERKQTETNEEPATTHTAPPHNEWPRGHRQDVDRSDLRARDHVQT